MSLAQAIADLAVRIGRELKVRVTPEHPGVARAWVSFGWDPSKTHGHVVIHAAHNVEEVMRLSPGRYRVIFANPMPDAHYCWLATARNSGNSKNMKLATARAMAEDKTYRDLELAVTTVAGNLADSSEINVVVYR